MDDADPELLEEALADLASAGTSAEGGRGRSTCTVSAVIMTDRGCVRAIRCAAHYRSLAEALGAVMKF